MAISWLQNKLTAAGAPKKSVIDILKKNMGGYEKARDHTTVHASDVTKANFCPKQLALLAITDKKKKDQYINTALRATFDVGNVTSDLFREKWAGSASHGFWKCTRCGYLSAFGIKPDIACKSGGRCDCKYVEASFFSDVYGISGSVDVFLDLDQPKLVVTELKIITPVDFEELAAPLAEHRIRTNLYMKLIEDDPGIFKHRINLKEAKVVYVSRAYGKKHPDYNEILPFKEFEVQRNDDSLTPYLAKAAEVKLFKEQGQIPHGVCATSMTATAKACSVCSECFSGKYSTGSMHPEVIMLKTESLND
jgi:hypothetical protein